MTMILLRFSFTFVHKLDFAFLILLVETVETNELISRTTIIRKIQRWKFKIF